MYGEVDSRRRAKSCKYADRDGRPDSDSPDAAELKELWRGRSPQTEVHA
jgi:hypothetical protein